MLSDVWCSDSGDIHPGLPVLEGWLSDQKKAEDSKIMPDRGR